MEVDTDIFDDHGWRSFSLFFVGSTNKKSSEIDTCL